MADPELRPMTEADVAGAARAWETAISELRVRLSLPTPPATPDEPPRLERRIAHLLDTDPEGSWVADDGGQIIGLAQAFIREGYWVLSLFGMDPAAQGSGRGRTLLDRALSYGPGLPGSIQASNDPRAARLYVTAGFDAHPSVDATGNLRRPVARPPGISDGSLSDLEVVAAVDRAVRHSARTVDVAYLMGEGAQLLLDGDQAYALVRSDRLVALAAQDQPSAQRVLQAALAQADGAFGLGWLTAGQQWAIRMAVDAGLALQPRGPMMVRGRPGPPEPYLPNGAFG